METRKVASGNFRNLVEMVVDPDAEAKKKLIESAYREAERQGLAVWCEDEAGPYQAIAQSGQSWEPLGHPVLHPHDYIRGGTAKMLTLLHPASGQVRVKGVISSTNVILHSWLKEQLQEMVAALPTRVIPSNTGEKERDRGEGEGPGRRRGTGKNGRDGGRDFQFVLLYSLSCLLCAGC